MPYHRIFLFFFIIVLPINFAYASQNDTNTGTVFRAPDTIKNTDFSTFLGLYYRGRGARVVFDRRKNRFINTNVHLFNAYFFRGNKIEIQVNTEFGNQSEAQEQAFFYSTTIGRIPVGLRKDIQTITIHKGSHPFGGGNNNILIHTGSIAQEYIRNNQLEEVLIHEAVHTSLDSRAYGDPAYYAAQRQDSAFISNNARNHPTREDAAESYLAYLQARFRTIRVPDNYLRTIESTIPNRLTYFSRLYIDLYPLVVNVPSGFVHLSTDFRGPNMRLDVFNGGSKNNMTHLVLAQNFSGQFWKFIPSLNNGYRMVTLFRGNNMCLDVADSGSQVGQPYLRPCSSTVGRNWYVRAASRTRVRLVTDFRGEEMCLDIFNGGTNNNTPHLTDCENFSGQFWTLTPSRFLNFESQPIIRQGSNFLNNTPQ